jgi:predicted aspartyl protease
LKLQYRDGLIFSSIKVTCNGKTSELNDVVVDTGASYCIIEPSAIEDLGIVFTKDDEIETFYGVNSLFSYVKRSADKITLDDVSIPNVPIYIGSVSESINALLGLDVLLSAGAIIDLKKMEIRFE